MPADDVLPWKLLLSKLRRSDDSRVSYNEVLRTGWQPEVLVVRERVLEYGKADDYEPPGCVNGCLPNVNYDLGAAELEYHPTADVVLIGGRLYKHSMVATGALAAGLDRPLVAVPGEALDPDRGDVAAEAAEPLDQGVDQHPHFQRVGLGHLGGRHAGSLGNRFGIGLQAFATLPNSAAKFNRPILWRMTFWLKLLMGLLPGAFALF